MDVSGPDDGVALGLTAVSSLMLEVQLQQVELRQPVLLLRPLDDGPVLVRPSPGEDWGVQASGGIAG